MFKPAFGVLMLRTHKGFTFVRVHTAWALARTRRFSASSTQFCARCLLRAARLSGFGRVIRRQLASTFRRGFPEIPRLAHQNQAQQWGLPRRRIPRRVGSDRDGYRRAGEGVLLLARRAGRSRTHPLEGKSDGRRERRHNQSAVMAQSFGAARKVGRQVKVDGQSATVRGIMPPAFAFR